MKRTIILALASLAFLILSIGWMLGASVTLAWNANPEPDIASYIVYCGTNSRAYPISTNVGKVTVARVDGLVEEATWYFAVTAVNTSGLEGDFSSEISVLISSTNHPPTITKIPDMMILEDHHTNVLFTIWDMETNPTNLVVTVTSGNTVVLKNEGIQLLHNGPHCEMLLNPEPNASGNTLVTVVVSDGMKGASSTFTLTVMPVPEVINQLVFLSGIQASPSVDGPWTNITTIKLPIEYQTNLFYRAWGPVLQLP